MKDVKALRDKNNYYKKRIRDIEVEKNECEDQLENSKIELL